ncbi:MAG: hypothetical protein LBO63_02170 [Oscillospiraceae bacterium]|jgi:hypothetical protein|nr:hypothetical protein [Oscillospiraceae bacterium]
MTKRISALLEELTLPPPELSQDKALSCENIREIAIKKLNDGGEFSPVAAPKPKKKRLTILLAAAIIVALLSGTAIAVRQALRYEDIAETPGTTVVAKTPLGNVTFTVRETIYDGKKFEFTLAVTPPNPQTLLFSTTEGDMAEQLRMFYGDRRVLDGEITLAQYMAEHGYTTILVLGFADYTVEPDGTIVCAGINHLWSGSGTYAPGETAYAKIDVLEAVLGADGNQMFGGTDSAAYGMVKTVTIPVKVSGKYTQEELITTYTADNINHSIPELGIRVDKIVINSTVTQSYGKIYWTIADSDKYYSVVPALRTNAPADLFFAAQAGQTLPNDMLYGSLNEPPLPGSRNVVLDVSNDWYVGSDTVFAVLNESTPIYVVLSIDMKNYETFTVTFTK